MGKSEKKWIERTRSWCVAEESFLTMCFLFSLSSKKHIKISACSEFSVRVEEPVKRVACCLSLRVRRVFFYFLPASGMKKLCLGWQTARRRTRHDELYSNKLWIVRLMVFALAAVSTLHPKAVWSEFFKPGEIEFPGTTGNRSRRLFFYHPSFIVYNGS